MNQRDETRMSRRVDLIRPANMRIVVGLSCWESLIADEARERHRVFRNKHRDYFYSTERVVDGKIIPRESNPVLDRESFRLFEIATKADQRASDYEYELRRQNADKN